MPAGRPPKPAIPVPREVRALTPDEAAAIAPLTDDGVPDFYNYLPTRFVPLPEAQSRGWSLFYDGRQCRYGHIAPRYVSNVNLCVDCKRIKAGKQPIGGKAGGTPQDRIYTKKAPAPGTATSPTLMPVRPLEPDASEKKFLVAYADQKDFDTAAKAAGLTSAQVHARLSMSEVFRRATNDLEDRLFIKQTVPDPVDFAWDDDKRTKLVTVYIDTGDLVVARDSIRVTPSEFYKERERNPEFEAMLRTAEPLSNKVFEETAASLARQGNDKLLTLVLKAKLPEYRDRLSMDLNVTEKLTDEQLDNRLRKLYTAAVRRNELAAIDADCTVVALAPAETGVAGSAGGERAAPSEKSFNDLL